ncbi:hypothetical protein M9H77_08082 [Catharanthus roseus]|uniref:Uncharacterized protein n=1 Tax=Catharanthus roseus TaxID=4058 RepID=A0ACC0BWZ9_CATRO|nr:hypothetical protein M9H77_08082 [Catharanthus roseus]
MLVVMESMLMVEATMDMETSFLEDMMVMETSLIKDIMELKEISNEDSCDNMNEKSIEEEECIETKERDIVEEKERFIKRLFIFDPNSILSKESEHFNCPKEKESELERSERESRKSWNFENFLSSFPHHNFEVFEFVKYKCTRLPRLIRSSTEAK